MARKPSPFKTRRLSAVKQAVQSPRRTMIMEALNILAELERVKPMYSRLDEITQRLIGQDLSGTGLAIIDNFADKNVAWKSSAIRHFELKRVVEG